MPRHGFVMCGLMLSVLVNMVLISGCKKGSTGATKNVPSGGQEIRAVELPITYSAVTHIAFAKGYIEQEGLKYRVLSVPAGPDIIRALGSGGEKAADIGSIAVTPIAVMIGAGGHPVVLSTCIQSDREVQLVTFTGTGITEDPRTLRGKKIGYVGSTVGEIYLSRLLKKANLTERDIRAVNGRPADLKALLLRGDIEAAVLWDPFVVQAVREGKSLAKTGKGPQLGEPIVFVEPGLYTMTFNVVATKDKLNQRRPELVKFLKACIRSGDFIRSNPDEARRMLETWLGLEDGDLRRFMQTTSFKVHLDSAQIKADLGSELLWLQERQQDTIVPADLSSYIDPSLLREADPSRVSE